jgi:acetylornithine deacetylase/succinyl-diaminopimelate desuccinylase-like protein
MSSRIAATIFLCALITPFIARGQAAAPAAVKGNPAAQGPGAGRAGGGPGDPIKFQQQILEMVKDKLESTDDEWKALSPRIEKVMEAQRGARTGAGMSITSSNANGQSGRTTGGGNVNTTPGKAMQEVRVAIDDKETSAEEITKKLAAMRDARDKARAELAEAQKSLKENLSPRQEAVLVTLGLLD